MKIIYDDASRWKIDQGEHVLWIGPMGYPLVSSARMTRVLFAECELYHGEGPFDPESIAVILALRNEIAEETEE